MRIYVLLGQKFELTLGLLCYCAFFIIGQILNKPFGHLVTLKLNNRSEVAAQSKYFFTAGNFLYSGGFKFQNKVRIILIDNNSS